MPKPSAQKIPVFGTAWQQWFPAILIFVAVIAAFWPAFSAVFIWDDNAMLTDNALIRGPLNKFWLTTEPIDYFPLTYSSLWVEWRMWGLNPIGYHITNVVMHACSCVLLWRVFDRLKFPAAWLAALIFAVHPVNVASVAWIAERKNVLAMFFYVQSAWAFVCFVQYRRCRYYVISLIAFLLSLLAKPAAVGWPFVAAAIAWWSLSSNRDANETQYTLLRRVKRCCVLVCPFLFCAIAVSAITTWFIHQRPVATDHHTLLWQMGSAGRAFWFYLAKDLLPIRLMAVYPLWKTPLPSVIDFLSGIGLAALVGMSWQYRNSFGKTVLLALGYFLLLLAPVLGFVPIGMHRFTYVTDHWQYFALPSVAVMAASALRQLKNTKQWGVILVIALGSLTFARCQVFQNSERLWADTLSKDPVSWLALANLGSTRVDAGKVEDGIQLCEQSLKLNPAQPEPYVTIGLVQAKAGNLNDATKNFEIATRISPDFGPAHYTLATALRQQGKIDEAIIEYRQALRCEPYSTLTRTSLGTALMTVGQRDEGMACLRQAVAQDPDDVYSLVNLGSYLIYSGSAQDAIAPLRKAISLSSTNADAHAFLGNALLTMTQTQAASNEFKTAVTLCPSNQTALLSLANCLTASGQNDAAAELYEQILALNPQHAESHFQLGVIQVSENQKQSALKHFREAARLMPNWFPAVNNLARLLATDPNSTPTDRVQAVSLAQHAVELSGGQSAIALDTVGVALARNEVFGEASNAARAALQLAIQTGQTNLAVEIQKRIDLYNQRRPYLQP